LDEQYPGYGLAKHKGYITTAHTQAIAKLGVLDIHRKSYANIVRALAENVD
jgi:ribonuclease HII